MTKLRRVLLISLLSWGVTFSAFAAPHQQCWKEEGFSSPAAFQAAVQDWKTRKPQMPNPIEIVRGLLALKKIEAQAEQVFPATQDKSRHCYVGCRLAQKIDYRIAVYAGWEKERRDLNDCSHLTDFELKDYLATTYGAGIGRDQSQPESCRTECVAPQI